MTDEQESSIKDFIGLLNVLKTALKGQRKWLAITTIDLAIKQLQSLRKTITDGHTES